MTRETQAQDRWEREKLRATKEEFLRDKLYSVHIYLSKTLLTLSSTTLILSVGFRAYVGTALKNTELLIAGWGFLIACIVMQMFMIKSALEYYYGCYNNHTSNKSEHDENALKSESGVIRFNRFSFWAWLIGISLILTFIFINLTPTSPAIIK